MANLADFVLDVYGKRGDVARAFSEIENRVDVHAEDMTQGQPYLFWGDVKWAIQDSPLRLEDLCKKHKLVIEAMSEEPGMAFCEHYIYSPNGLEFEKEHKFMLVGEDEPEGFVFDGKTYLEAETDVTTVDLLREEGKPIVDKLKYVGVIKERSQTQNAKDRAKAVSNVSNRQNSQREYKHSDRGL